MDGTGELYVKQHKLDTHFLSYVEASNQPVSRIVTTRDREGCGGVG
jgi:hypothetical protein